MIRKAVGLLRQRQSASVSGLQVLQVLGCRTISSHKGTVSPDLRETAAHGERTHSSPRPKALDLNYRHAVVYRAAPE